MLAAPVGFSGIRQMSEARWSARTVSRVLFGRIHISVWSPDRQQTTRLDCGRLFPNCSLMEQNILSTVPQKRGLSSRSAKTSGREEADEPLGEFAGLRQRDEVAPRKQLDLQAEPFSS